MEPAKETKREQPEEEEETRERGTDSMGKRMFQERECDWSAR